MKQHFPLTAGGFKFIFSIDKIYYRHNFIQFFHVTNTTVETYTTTLILTSYNAVIATTMVMHPCRNTCLMSRRQVRLLTCGQSFMWLTPFNPETPIQHDVPRHPLLPSQVSVPL